MRYYSKHFTGYYYPGHWIQDQSYTHSATSQLPGEHSGQAPRQECTHVSGMATLTNKNKDNINLISDSFNVAKMEMRKRLKNWEKKNVRKGALLYVNIFFLYKKKKSVLLVFKEQIITWIKAINEGKKKKKNPAAYIKRETGLTPSHSESTKNRAKILEMSEAHRRQPHHEQAGRTADPFLPKSPRPKAESISV